MTIKPILFSAPMVQAILEGTKTQTRRIIKSKHESGLFQVGKTLDGVVTGITSIDWDERPKNDTTNDIKPIANVGDVLWCRETWIQIHTDREFEGRTSEYVYRADEKQNEEKFGDIWNGVGKRFIDSWKWKPSIFMPKRACRLFLKVTGVRAERLHDITDGDAIAEGIIGVDRAGGYGYGLKQEWDYNFPLHEPTAILAYKELWQSINGMDSWDANPWVWVYEFERIEKPDTWPYSIDINTLRGGSNG
ncbi:hypothetical protein [Sphingobacterium corticibacter]|uniref:ASCH domain-containing protein n=1 Tax=Sphingobacterium corticibacter TaxID=2171749 RepID=A0A2T8HNM8_9SPHI|nr:hypothetical protein [Sphingobacterium corticibacter]PVH27031.1 hypothetical protein DC487_05390 [Sphingobacterium corticibacter]